MTLLSILLVDDHPIVCEGYRALLDRQPGLRVCASVPDARAAWAAWRVHRPDLGIVDLAMPGPGGLEALRRIRQGDPVARLLVLSMHGSPGFALQAFRAGARGYVTKSSPPDLLVQAARDVLAGRMALSPDIAAALAAEHVSGDAPADARLSPREFEILRHLVAGRDAASIAALLCLSPKTVANTRLQIRAKLGVRSDAALVLYAIREGWINAAARTETGKGMIEQQRLDDSH
jgi:two-component system, NarL family, invasion response regulator UvrY